MWIANRRVWYDFTYNLWYPAILGSMIYDVADIGSASFGGPSYWLKTIILAFYCVDYVFLYGNVRKEIGEQEPWKLIVDVIVAILYRIAFSFGAASEYKLALVAMAAAMLFIMCYLNRSRLEKVYIRTLYFSFIAFIATYSCADSSTQVYEYPIVSMVVILVLYSLYAFLFVDIFVRRGVGGLRNV